MSCIACLVYTINDFFVVLNYYWLRLSLQAKGFNIVAKQSVQDAIGHNQ